MKLYTESTSVDGVLVSLISGDMFEVSPFWATVDELARLGEWLGKNGAEYVGYFVVPGSEWENHQWIVPDDSNMLNAIMFGDEYDAWIEEQWAAMQDYEALCDDALEGSI